MKKVTNKLLFNVPYNPETNSIEKCFSKTKNYIRKHKNNNTEQLKRTIIKAFNCNTPNDRINYFNSSLKLI